MRRGERRDARRAQELPLFTRVRHALASGALFTADRYTVDGVTGKTAGFVDHIDATHTLSQAISGKQVVVPAASSVLGGRLAAAFLGAESYASSRPASAWRHLHDGTGCSVLAVFDPRATLLANAFNTVVATGVYASSVTGGSFGWRTANPTPGIGFRCKDGATSVFDAQSNTLATSFTAIGTYLHWEYKEGNSPEYVAREKGNQESTGNSLAAPNTGDPSGTLTLGSAAGGASAFATMNWCALLVSPRVWTTVEQTTIRSWILGYCGVAA